MFANLCGRSKTTRKRCRVDGHIFEKGLKVCVFKQKRTRVDRALMFPNAPTWRNVSITHVHRSTGDFHKGSGVTEYGLG